VLCYFVVRDEERRVDREQPRKQITGDRFLETLGIDSNKWSVGDRRIALLGIGIVLLIVIIAVGGYVFGWAWTGLTKPQQRTFWDWLSLLIVPIVLALGGYLFNRSESRRTKEDAERQRTADRQIADQRAQDEALQAYLDQMGQLLLDKDRPLRQAREGDEVRILARARTKEVLWKLSPHRKRSVLQFLHEASLIQRGKNIIDLSGADLRKAYLYKLELKHADLRGADVKDAGLSGANLSEADLRGADLRGADLLGVDLSDATLSGARIKWLDQIAQLPATRRALEDNEQLERQAESLEGATMPDGQKYEDWLKSRDSGQDG
jgi:hypothetical protein